MRDRASLPQPGDVVAGKYLIERMIGSAGQSIVFGARHASTGKRLAIKWLALDGRDDDDDDDDDDGDEFDDYDEDLGAHAQVVGHFRHPNVLDIYDVGHLNGATYIVMDWLEGESLAHRLLRVRSLPLAEAYRVLAPSMRGMHEAHEAGIVHGELKPANIFICAATKFAAETVKVLDFGVSKLSSSGAELSTALARYDESATEHLHYLAPEQLRGLAIDRRTDVYAFGVMLYRALAGRHPYPADRVGELIWQVASEPEPTLEGIPGIPPAIDAMVARAMAREAADRFPTLLALADAFEQCLRSPHLEAITRSLAASTRRPSPPPLRRRPSVSPALAAHFERGASSSLEDATTGPVPLPPDLPPLEPRRSDRRPLYVMTAVVLALGVVRLSGYFAHPVGREEPAQAAAPALEKPASTSAVSSARGSSVGDLGSTSIANGAELARLVNEACGVQASTTTSMSAATTSPPLRAAELSGASNKVVATQPPRVAATTTSPPLRAAESSGPSPKLVATQLANMPTRIAPAVASPPLRAAEPTAAAPIAPVAPPPHTVIAAAAPRQTETRRLQQQLAAPAPIAAIARPTSSPAPRDSPTAASRLRVPFISAPSPKRAEPPPPPPRRRDVFDMQLQ